MSEGRYDVIVVGGGPAGLSAGIELARRGIQVLLIEQKKEIGFPMQCGEVVGRLFMEESGFSPDLPWVVAPIGRLRMVMPNGSSVTVSRKGYCIRRDFFDRWLFDEYAGLGGEAHLGEKVLRAEEKRGVVLLRTTGGGYRAGYVVAADGPLSRCAVSLGLREKAECISAVQYKFRARGDHEVGTLSFYLSGGIADGYFWIFPRGEEISVGVGGSDGSTLRAALDDFCRRRGLDPRERISAHAGLVPDRGPVGKVASERVVVCGDAAGLIHPLSKAGIHLAVYSGREAGRAVAGREKSGGSLSPYSRAIGRIEAFRQPHFGRLRSATSYTDREYNLMGEAASDSPSGKPRIGRILIRPAVWPLLPRHLALYAAYARTARWIW